MLFADQQVPVVALSIVIAGFVALGVVVLYVFRTFERLASGALKRRYDGIEVHPMPQPGDVVLTYHTYHGLILWVTQRRHHVAASPADARRLLDRLLGFNLSWGLLNFRVVFIVPLAILNYRAQRKSIAEQERTPLRNDRSLLTGSNGGDDGAAAPSVSLSPSAGKVPLFYKILAWTCLGLAALFAVGGIVGLVSRESDAALGGLLLAGLFGYFGRYYLRHQD